MTERKALGRGLSSLIRPGTTKGMASAISAIGEEVLEKGQVILEVPVGEIRINPRQPRRYFSEQALDDLQRSIREHGILQPLVLRKTASGYELVAGERRLRASRKAGLQRVPAILRATTDQAQLELALIENLQREDLTPIEEARGYETLAKEFSFTQEAIAQKVGKDRSTITNLLRLLKLPATVQEQVDRRALSMGHARALLSLDSTRQQEALANQIEKEELSVRQVEQLVRQGSKTKGKKHGRTSVKSQGNVNLRHMADELQRKLGTKVEVTAAGKGGEIRIRYYGAEDLRRLTEEILG